MLQKSSFKRNGPSCTSYQERMTSLCTHLVGHHSCYDDVYLCVYTGTSLFAFGVFILSNVLFAFVDLTGIPHQLHKYKIQETKNAPVRYNKLENN